jgi:hypothetical protein
MRGWKLFCIAICMLLSGVPGICQSDSGQVKAESTRVQQVPPMLLSDTDTPVKKLAAVKKDSTQHTPRVIAAIVHDSAVEATKQILRDSLLADSLQKAHKISLRAAIDTSTYRRYESHPYLGWNKQPVFMLTEYRHTENKDRLFYLVAGLLFCLAFIKAGFPKYFRNLFLLFFQTSLRQKQTRDQLLQDNLASLLINLLYFMSAGLFMTLLVIYYQWASVEFWILALVSVGALVVIYLGKYLFLLFSGWVFNAREAAGSYIFLVFMVNKVMGVLLLPFLLILAFAKPAVAAPAVTISLVMVGLLFAYRYFVSFNAIRNKLKVNVLHFFLYLCAVEVLPLLLIYKLLISYIDGKL